VLQVFERTLAEVVSLALFIPLVIGTGGNTGAQAATTVTRAMAVGEVRMGDLGFVILREARVGLLLGTMLALIAFIPATVFAGRGIGTVVSVTLVVVCTLAAFIGALLPLVARRIGVDPAVMSAPFITTLVDASGLIVYFLVARAVLGLG
jgi:magnesium transporter